jgi:hypothetical protein
MCMKQLVHKSNVRVVFRELQIGRVVFSQYVTITFASVIQFVSTKLYIDGQTSLHLHVPLQVCTYNIDSWVAFQVPPD